MYFSSIFLTLKPFYRDTGLLEKLEWGYLLLLNYKILLPSVTLELTSLELLSLLRCLLRVLPGLCPIIFFTTFDIEFSLYETIF
jgi:hypothetical protein